MSAATASAVLPALALRESRRILLHPVPIGLLLASLGPIWLDPPTEATSREIVSGALSFAFLFLLPVAAIFAANLVASSARRAGTEEMLAPLPTGPDRRALAVCAGGGGVMLLAAAAVVVQYLISRQNGSIVTETYLTVWESVGAVAIHAGAVAFGVAVARWLPWPGAILLCAVGLILWTYSGIDNPHIATVPYVLDVNFWGDEANLNFAHRVSDAWHAGYLACLTALAVAAAALRDRPRRLVAVGAPLAALAAACAAVSWP